MLIVLESILWVIRFFFGACIFSFLNVVIDRLPRGESVVNGRSHCTNCGRVLHAWELIPCVSYIFLRGRCAGCKSHIPGRDFFVEVIVAQLLIDITHQHKRVRWNCRHNFLISQIEPSVSDK